MDSRTCLSFFEAEWVDGYGCTPYSSNLIIKLDQIQARVLATELFGGKLNIEYRGDK